MGRVTWIMTILGLVAAAAEGVMFHLQPNTQKCLREEIHKDVLVSGEYEVQESPGQRVDIQVTIKDWCASYPSQTTSSTNALQFL